MTKQLDPKTLYEFICACDEGTTLDVVKLTERINEFFVAQGTPVISISDFIGSDHGSSV